MRHRILELISLRSVQIAIIFVIAVATYLPILNNKYAYDDPAFFQEWTTPRSFDNVSKFIEGDTPADHGGVYRPFRTFIYAIDYSLWGENPVGYHAQAIVINALMAVVAYLIVTKLKTPQYTALLTGVLFAVLPVHTEAITFTTASIDSWGILFALSSIYLYLESASNKNIVYYLSILLSICAYLTYEITLVVPLLVLLHRYIFIQHKNPIDRRGKRGIAWIFVGTLYYAFMRIFVATNTQAGTSVSSLYLYNVLSSFKFYYQYITTILFPWHLSIYHQISNSIRTFSNLSSSLTEQPIFDLHLAMSFVTLSILVYILLRTRRSYPIVAFGIGWYMISLLPVMNLFPTRTLFAERYSYMASFGIVLCIAYVLSGGIHNSRIAKILTPLIRDIVTLIIVIICIATTMYRNTQWYDNGTLWTEVAHNAPWAAAGWNGLGLWSEDTRNIKKAYMYYKKAIATDTTYVLAHYNLARLDYDVSNMKEALTEINLAIKYDPNNPAYIASRLKIQDRLNDPFTHRQNRAIDATDRIRELVNKGHLQEALDMSRTALQTNPNDTVLLNDAAVISLQLKQYNQGINYLLKAQKSLPSDPDIYFNLANAFIAVGQTKKAKASLRIAIELKPDFQAAKDLLSTLH